MLAGTIHKFSTAAAKSSGVRCAPTAFRSVGLLNVLQRVRLRGPPGHPLAGRAWRNALRSALSPLRNENL